MIAPLSRLFLRTYAVLATVLIAGLVLAVGWGAALRRPPDVNAVETLIRAPTVVREAFAEAPPGLAAERVAQTLRAEVRLHSFDRLPPMPPPVRRRLEAGEFVVPHPGGQAALFMPLGDQVVEVRPRMPPPPPIELIAAGVLLALAAGILMQLRPLDRQLQRLASAAQAFGQGDRQVRVEVTPRAATADLSERFNAMADRIAELIDSQRDLLLAVSHELRTPLNRLRFAAELLAQEPDEAVRSDKLAELHGDLDELDGLVAELLTFFRLEQAGVPAATAVEVGPLVRRLVADASRLQPGLEAEADRVDHVIWGDPGLIRRALSKVIANAARYATRRIAVHAMPSPTEITVCVDDDGPGIPASERARVLEPFVRLDAARDRDAGGSGLGLAVAHRIVTSYGGRLAIDDAPQGGARVALTLPKPPPDGG